MTFLKKTNNLTIDTKRSLIDSNHETLSIEKQCDLLSLPRSSYYYKPTEETPENLKIMNLIDEQHTMGVVPYGQLKLVYYLTQKLGYPINVKRVRLSY